MSADTTMLDATAPAIAAAPPAAVPELEPARRLRSGTTVSAAAPLSTPPPPGTGTATPRGRSASLLPKEFVLLPRLGGSSRDRPSARFRVVSRDEEAGAVVVGLAHNTNADRRELTIAQHDEARAAWLKFCSDVTGKVIDGGHEVFGRVNKVDPDECKFPFYILWDDETMEDFDSEADWCAKRGITYDQLVDGLVRYDQGDKVKTELVRKKQRTPNKRSKLTAEEDYDAYDERAVRNHAPSRSGKSEPLASMFLEYIKAQNGMASKLVGAVESLSKAADRMVELQELSTNCTSAIANSHLPSLIAALAAAAPARIGRPPSSTAKAAAATAAVAAAAIAGAAAGDGGGGSTSAAAASTISAHQLAAAVQAAAARAVQQLQDTMTAIEVANYHVKATTDDRDACAFALSSKPDLANPPGGHKSTKNNSFVPMAALERMSNDYRFVGDAGNEVWRFHVCQNCKEHHVCVPMSGGSSPCVLCLKTRASGAFCAGCNKDIVCNTNNQTVYLGNVVNAVMRPLAYKYRHNNLIFGTETRTSNSAGANATREKRFDMTMRASVNAIKLFVGVEIISTCDLTDDSLKTKLKWLQGQVEAHPNNRSVLLVVGTMGTYEQLHKRGLPLAFARSWLAAFMEHADGLPANKVLVVTLGLEEAQCAKLGYAAGAKHFAWGTLPRDLAHEFKYNMVHREPQWFEDAARGGADLYLQRVTMQEVLA